MKNRIIQVPVTLDSANRKKDRSVKFAFTTTREITTDEFLIVDTYHQSAGWLLFKENEFKEEEKELLDNVDKLPLLSSANNGRVTRAAGYAMLAELYINAAVS